MSERSGTDRSLSGGTPGWPELYHQAFLEFGTRALWNMRELDRPSPLDALAAARQLRVEGDLKARRFAEDLERSARADL